MKVTFGWLSLLLLFTFCTSVPSEKESQAEAMVVEVDKLSEGMPFGLLVKKARSYHQALPVVERLQEMGWPAYTLRNKDEEGWWYYVVAQSVADSVAADTVRAQLAERGIFDEVEIIHVGGLDTAAQVDLVEGEIVERKRIVAEEPDVPEVVMDVVEKFPVSQAFDLESGLILGRPQVKDRDYMKFMERRRFGLHLPKGITIDDILEEYLSFSEVVYSDNLNGDEVVMQIGRREQVEDYRASFFSVGGFDPYELAERYVKLVKRGSRGRMLEEERVEVRSFVVLKGYRMVEELEDGGRMTWVFLADESGRYVVMANSEDQAYAEMEGLLRQVGMKEGLKDYDSFYNTFYVFPNLNIKGDLFFGYEFERLGWDYARSKGYSDWSKEMVGHYVAQAYMHNKKRGMWTFSLFDLVSEEKQAYVHGTLYSGGERNRLERTMVRDVEANVVSQVLKRRKFIDEVNFPKGRFIVAVDNSDYSDLNLKELVQRAEILQVFESGDLPVRGGSVEDPMPEM